MSEHSPFEAGIETRDVSSGWQAVYHRGDGTGVKSWGPTEEMAEENLKEVLDDE